jgi:hypothetical protein
MNTTEKTGLMKLGFVKNLKPNINGEIAFPHCQKL